MADPARLDLSADYYLPFVKTITRVGVDYSGWTFSLMVRLVPNGDGTPIVSLGSVMSSTVAGIYTQYAGTDTIANHISAGRLTSSIRSYVNPATGLNYADGDSVAVSILRVLITQAMMTPPTMPEPEPEEAGDDKVLAWDLTGDDGAGPELLQKVYFGSFTVRGTVTHA